MPTIEGSVEEAGRIIVVDEETGTIDSNTEVSSGAYSVSSSSLDPKIVLFRRSDGSTLGYSGIASLDDTPFLGESGTFANGVNIKVYGYIAGTMVGDSKFLSMFRNQTPMVPYYTVGTISGQSVSFTESVVCPITVNGKLYYDPTYNKVLHVTDTQYRVCTLSNNILTVDSTTNFSTAPCFTPSGYESFQVSSTYYNQDTHQLFIVYIRIPDYRYSSNQDTLYCNLRVVVATFNGSSFSFGNYLSITSFTTFWYQRWINSAIAYYPPTGGYCISYCRAGDEYTASLNMLEVNGSVITNPYSTYSTGSVLSGTSLGMCYDPNRSLFFLSVGEYYSGNYKIRLIPFSYSGGVLTRLTHYEFRANYNTSTTPIVDYDEASEKILLTNDQYAAGYTSKYRTFSYNVSTGFSIDSTVTYDANSGYAGAAFIRDPDTGKRVVVYSSTPDFLGAAKVFRL